MKERNPSPEVEGLTPSEQPTGRRLFEAQGVSRSAERDQRHARWIRGRFLKKATQKLLVFFKG